MQTLATDTTLPVRVPLVTEPWGILRTLSTARRNMLEVLPELAVKQPIVSGRTGARWHMVMDPASLRHILKDGLANYPKSRATKNMLRPAIGDSLFVAEGAHWHWQRRAAAPVFAMRNITNLAPMMSAAAAASVARLEHAGGQADCYEEMVTATFEVISDVTFSGDSGFDRTEMHAAIDAYVEQTGKVSLLDLFGVPAWVPRPGRVFSTGSLRRMKSVADHVIDARRDQSGPGRGDLLDLLLDGADPETGRRMTTAELRDNLLTFIVAGHETTALTLSWALYLCAFDRQVQTRARAEAQELLQGRIATAADCANLPYTRQIIDEALRLYPPAAMLARTALAPDELCGREIRAGDTVLIPIYALHRNALLWDRPDAFDPDRFADPAAIDRFAYLPFGAGPRVCIGASFAIQEAVIMLATLLSRFRFKPVPGRDPQPVMILTLRPEGGVWLDIESL